LPAIVERTLTTREEGQRTLWVRLRQGELPRWSDNAPLGAFELHGVRAAPAGEARVVARFSLDSSGMLEVGAGTAEGPLVVRPWRGRNA
jgi:molecular chaperone DnaK (HSP70)